MPIKRLKSETTPTLVAERLQQWGEQIRIQRIHQRLRMQDLAYRIDVSVQTVQRMEHGDPTVQAASYLNTLLVLGILDELAPPPGVLMAPVGGVVFSPGIAASGGAVINGGAALSGKATVSGRAQARLNKVTRVRRPKDTDDYF